MKSKVSHRKVVKRKHDSCIHGIVSMSVSYIVKDSGTKCPGADIGVENLVF